MPSPQYSPVRVCGRAPERGGVVAASRAGDGLRQAWRCGNEGPPPVATHDRDRAVALSLQLARAHQELRNRLRDLRARPGSLTEHCLAFCTALTAHHEGEDAGMFADLLRRRPDLAGVVKNLAEDHEMISSILTRVAQLAERARDAPLPDERGPIDLELDGLTAIMENHFRYEERAIGAALDQDVTDSGWSEQAFRFHAPGDHVPRTANPG